MYGLRPVSLLGNRDVLVSFLRPLQALTSRHRCSRASDLSDSGSGGATIAWAPRSQDRLQRFPAGSKPATFPRDAVGSSRSGKHGSALEAASSERVLGVEIAKAMGIVCDGFRLPSHSGQPWVILHLPPTAFLQVLGFKAHPQNQVCSAAHKICSVGHCWTLNTCAELSGDALIRCAI